MQIRWFILTLAILTSPARAEQPEIPLPVITGSTWDLLSDVGLREYETITGEWLFEKIFPAALKAAAEAPLEITGYIVPISAELWQSELLLVRNTEDCPFCGSDGYGPVLEVSLAKPTKDITEFAEVTVTGSLVLVEDPDTMQSVRMVEATLQPTEN